MTHSSTDPQKLAQTYVNPKSRGGYATRGGEWGGGYGVGKSFFFLCIVVKWYFGGGGGLRTSLCCCYIWLIYGEEMEKVGLEYDYGGLIRQSCCYVVQVIYSHVDSISRKWG